MSGLGGLNRSPDGVVIGLVQAALPTVTTRAELAEQAERGTSCGFPAPTRTYEG